MLIDFIAFAKRLMLVPLEVMDCLWRAFSPLRRSDISVVEATAPALAKKLILVPVEVTSDTLIEGFDVEVKEFDMERLRG